MNHTTDLQQVPPTLLEVCRHFSDADVCHNFFVDIRWSDGVTCPRCHSPKVSFVKSRRIWNCLGCRK